MGEFRGHNANLISVKAGWRSAGLTFMPSIVGCPPGLSNQRGE